LPSLDKSHVLSIVRVAKTNKFKHFFSENTFKDNKTKAEKEEFVSLFTGIMNDCIGTDLEDYISGILEEMPGAVIGKIRSNLIGINTLIEEIKSGEIRTFGDIDDKRMRVMLSMNDIDLTALVINAGGRKKKNETWAEHFKRVKEIKSSSKKLGREKVDVDLATDVRSLTRTLNTVARAGKHGDLHTKIVKVYNSDLEFPEFAEFRKTNFGDGTITPAFHGTGGIAAAMILRYGFKVIKSTDPSVVGRMLGDGIYFSNKIDKTTQYVGNSGYTRKVGTKGYIFEVDNTLGKLSSTKEGPDYRVMGLGNDNVRSPEWCVRDPKKQLAIRKVYEVELVSPDMYKQYVKEDGTRYLTSFKSFITENASNMSCTSFIFRDGEIPIFKLNKKGHIEEIFVDFEEAVASNQLPVKFLDKSMHGPVVLFDQTKETKTFDIRFARGMNGEAFSTYKKYFIERILLK
jgi:hypothetical protein